MRIVQELLNHTPISTSGGAPVDRGRYPALIKAILLDRLSFRPSPPGDERSAVQLTFPNQTIEIEVTAREFHSLTDGLSSGALTREEVTGALETVSADSADAASRETILTHVEAGKLSGWDADLDSVHHLDRMALIAIQLIDRMQKSLLKVEPLTEVHFRFTPKAKAALAIGWEAMVKRGEFPLPPRGAKRFTALDESPCGGLHFVSASDLDSGFYYTMGIALSPEAQANGSMDVTFGLDGELIVPGQAVSPIPPFLAMATRLFAASIPTSSNISEEVQSIPIRSFPHPESMDDLEPRRGGILKPPIRPNSPEELITDLRIQLSRYQQELKRKKADPLKRLEGASEFELPEIGAVYEVTGLNKRDTVYNMTRAFEDPELDRQRKVIALYLNIEPTGSDRVGKINEVVDAARELGLKYVAVSDDVEDAWLPNLLEYLDPHELNSVADYADKVGIIVTDGRPVDPVYTAATAAQRIQSVYSTLSVDILKMGMWLCLDALTARKVWREILSNPHIPSQMLLMPIGIVEPWSAFVDNRRTDRTPRAILDPFEKIKFMIEEAELLKMPSLLTDTRHKATWVLLGRKRPLDQPHLRERFIKDSETGEIIGRMKDSARPLLNWDEFMQCERLARKAGVLLGQAGSVEVGQLFQIISETTYDAAKEGLNPATAIWTAETERVLRTRSGEAVGDLQTQRSAAVSPFLAVINRGMETHAKMDGWLRFLESTGMADPLRKDLLRRRQVLGDVLDDCIQVQRNDPKAYQEHFDTFRSAYLEYHKILSGSFNAVREKVTESWRRADAKVAR